METEKSLYPYLVEYMYVHICMYEWEGRGDIREKLRSTLNIRGVPFFLNDPLSSYVTRNIG